MALSILEIKIFTELGLVDFPSMFPEGPVLRMVCCVFDLSVLCFEERQELLHRSYKHLCGVSLYQQSVYFAICYQRLERKRKKHLFLSNISSPRKTVVLPDHPPKAEITPH